MKASKMNTMQTIYEILESEGLVQSGRQFSSEYANRSANWFTYQKHKQRDLSLNTAIECLRSIRVKLKRAETLGNGKTLALEKADQVLSNYIKDTGGIEIHIDQYAH
jgi:DNA-binding transcriptional regulator YhcF (GntR family)